MNLPEAILREFLLHSPDLFYLSLARPGRRKIRPFLHQLQPLYHAMVHRPIRIFIADEIGLGKTIQALAIARYLNLKGEAKRILILVPKILREQWREEIERIGVRPIVIESGEEVEEKLKRDGFFVVSIDLAKMYSHREKFLRKDWDLVIVDEAHNVTIGTQRYDFVKELIGRREDLNVIFLSATPHRGDSKDYLARLLLLDPTLVDDYQRLDSPEFYRRTMGTIVFRRTKQLVNKLEGKEIFKRCHFRAVVVGITEEEKEYFRKLNDVLYDLIKNAQKNSPIALLAILVNKRASSSYSSAMKTLSKIVESHYLKREANPERVQEYIEKLFGLGYDDIDLESFSEYDEIVEKIIGEYSAVLREKQVKEFKELLDLLKRIRVDSKIEVVANIVKNHVEKGEKVIVFTEFKDTLEYLRSKLSRLVGLNEDEVSILHGGMSSDKIREEIRKFERNGKLLISTDVASEGLNLQIASVLINYEAPWTPIKIEQRVGRVWRIDQEKDVKAYTIFLDTEVDMYVLNNLYERIMNIREVLGEGPRIGLPVPGERILEGDFETLWKDIPEEFESGEKVSEYDIGYAILRRDIEGYRKAILNTLKILRQNIRGAVLQERIESIRRDLEAIADERIEEIVKRYVRELMGKNVPDVSPILHRIMLSGDEFRKGLRVGVKKGKGELFSIKLVRNGKELHRFPIMVVDGEVIYGAKLLERLIDILKDGYVILGDSESHSSYEARVITIGRDVIYKVREKYKRYDRWLKRKGLKRGNLFAETMIIPEKVIEFEPIGDKLEIAKIIPIQVLELLNFSEDDVSLPTRNDLMLLERNFVPLEDILRAERKAMEIVIEIEKKRMREKYGDVGWEVRDVSLHEHYDVLVRTPEGEKYIEVKGHLPFLLQAELTEAEVRFAREHEENYWLYIVANLRKRPVILKIFKPFSNPRVLLVKDGEDVDVTKLVKANVREKGRFLFSLTSS
ncbi:putative deah atp-dependent helicase [Pyrococcus sp. NA2]|uniref:helicase-related protein n=1 Tax=Pyrococcus sp. (strain NA2) TaxID=342949 RepID=UPI000209ABF2|nr:helicase-related protein [Pyrococcus sp. NA2]AEC52118.1 putative deah atp-dependent helicase [Pyrococcus sp. NA2]